MTSPVSFAPGNPIAPLSLESSHGTVVMLLEGFASDGVTGVVTGAGQVLPASAPPPGPPLLLGEVGKGKRYFNFCETFITRHLLD